MHIFSFFLCGSNLILLSVNIKAQPTGYRHQYLVTGISDIPIYQPVFVFPRRFLHAIIYLLI